LYLDVLILVQLMTHQFRFENPSLVYAWSTLGLCLVYASSVPRFCLMRSTFGYAWSRLGLRRCHVAISMIIPRRSAIPMELCLVYDCSLVESMCSIFHSKFRETVLHDVCSGIYKILISTKSFLEAIYSIKKGNNSEIKRLS
jgi:hypothetical protein